MRQKILLYNPEAVFYDMPLALLAMVARRLGGGDGDFDFYVLALSWSPSYCAIEGDGADPAQCANGRPYAFVVHGLWPQYEKGYPRDCETSAAPEACACA